ncbi:uncharacterized protein LOC143037200 [Oratosquilla oratoria]|uniref:uncharacterized protein LOC143037200 n=1 Tax=Oratosquilla oratoria TaxID=337810 RepID=UPI003F76A014
MSIWEILAGVLVVLSAFTGRCESCRCKVTTSNHYPGTKAVECSNRFLEKIPTDCLDASVSELDVSSNLITEILTFDLAGAPNLKRFISDYNDLNFVNEKVFQQVPQIEEIYINQNPHLELARGVFHGLTHLKGLHLVGSHVKILPDLTDLTRIQMMDFRSCELIHLSRPTFGRVTSSSVFLNLSGNLMKDIAFDLLFDLPSDSTLNFDHDVTLWAQDAEELDLALSKPWKLNLDIRNMKVCGRDGHPTDPHVCDM